MNQSQRLRRYPEGSEIGPNEQDTTLLKGIRNLLIASQKEGHQIPLLGFGKYEAVPIQSVIESGYDGPIGIIDHLPAQDAEKKTYATSSRAWRRPC